METKFRVWDGKYMEEIDLYWFEENGVREVVDGVGDPHYGKAIVMQYTGLKDANGREVWEGDICKTAEGEVYEVKRGRFEMGVNHEYECTGYGFHFSPYDRGVYMLEDYEQLWGADDYEVIGNIYENPELLE